MHVPRDIVARIQCGLKSEPQAVSSGSSRPFSLLSWNIDGIDDHGPQDTMLRALAVAEHIATTQPVAVCLQEVIPPQLELLLAPQTLGGCYDVVCAENPSLPYYCAMLLHKRRVRRVSSQTRHFETSKMGRHLLSVDVVLDGCSSSPVTLLTTHLESTKSEKRERVRQLAEVFRVMAESASRSRTLILAGDLNVRDDEVVAARQAAGAGADRVLDAWQCCGSPKDHEFTWDMATNTNLGAPHRARCRFDRCLFAGGAWAPTSFELVGRTRAGGRFPSDHYGLQIAFAAASLAEGPCTPGGAEERARRRALAAERAEARLRPIGVRPAQAPVARVAEARGHRAVGGARMGAAEGASAARMESVSHAAECGASAAKGGAQASHTAGGALVAVDGEADEDLALAIALSLGARALERPAFVRLLGPSGQATIDLDD